MKRVVDVEQRNVDRPLTVLDAPEAPTEELTIWGGGYVGLSLAVHYATAGRRVLVSEVAEKRVRAINSGDAALPLFEDWLGLTLAPLVRAGLIRATLDSEEGLLNHEHFIAVPSENRGVPDMSHVFEIVERVARSHPNLVVIESTLTPGTSRSLLDRHPDLPLVIAPRRDWFLGTGRDLPRLVRVYGAANASVADAAEGLLRLVSPHLIRATSCVEAELAKCIENSLHHVSSIFACQLARAYPDANLNEALELAASHWRIRNVYFASAGTGGGCLPVATAHLVRGARVPQALSIARAVEAFEIEQRTAIAEFIVSQSSGPVGFLGLTYRGDVPVATLSPSLDVALLVAALGREVRAHDPYGVTARLSEARDIRSLSFPEGLRDCGAVFIGPDHRIYQDVNSTNIWRYVHAGQLIVDNEGAWSELGREIDALGARYVRIGGNHIRPRRRVARQPRRAGDTARRVRSRSIYESQWLRVREDVIERDGELLTYGVIERSDSVVIIPLTDNGETLLVEQDRYPTCEVSLEFPAGSMELSEDAGAAARRELMEECGVGADRFQEIGTFRPVPGLTEQRITVFLAWMSASCLHRARATPGVDEIRGLKFTTVRELKRMVAHGEITDGTTIGALTIAAAAGIIWAGEIA